MIPLNGVGVVELLDRRWVGQDRSHGRDVQAEKITSHICERTHDVLDKMSKGVSTVWKT